MPRMSPRGVFVASSATGAIVSPTVASSELGMRPARQLERFGATWLPAGEYQLRTLLFAICR
jgi:hypothetical protein